MRNTGIVRNLDNLGQDSNTKEDEKSTGDKGKRPLEVIIEDEPYCA